MGRLQQKRRVTRSRRQRAPRSKDHEAATIDSFRRDPEFAAFHLNSVLADGTQEEILLTLRRMSVAFGGVSELALKAGLNPTTLYRTLSARGNPELRSIRALLGAMGLRLAVTPLGQ
ncbi:MAG: addiction module antidote protein [Gammaproteobacteria bacterium]|nr:MAG: addiction module antidote protein [Gammaproteobacteria bacterium]